MNGPSRQTLDPAAASARRRDEARAAAPAQAALGGASNHAIAQLHQGGAPLDPQVRAEMEARFGEDFAAVRVHDDPGAQASAAALGAKAYTMGNDIVFGADRYAPQGGSGKRLLAHELA